MEAQVASEELLIVCETLVNRPESSYPVCARRMDQALAKIGGVYIQILPMHSARLTAFEILTLPKGKLI
jgi:hypothetical protein